MRKLIIRNKQQKYRGFVLLELIFVIGLTTIVGVIGGGVYSRVKQNEDIASEAMQIVRILLDARSKSTAGENDKEWKVKIETDRVKLEDEDNLILEEHILPAKYSLFSPIAEVVFDKIDGRVEICETGCVIELRETEGTLNYQFRILFSGAVEY